MDCPSCFLSNANLQYLCHVCSRLMCDECATFALRCGNTVCYECRHECGDPECREILLVHMTVGDLMRVYAGETFLKQHWERMGKSFSPDSIRILPDLSIHPEPVDSIPFSFPEILCVRVYHTEYTSLAKQLWQRIRLVNSVPDSISSYMNKVSHLSDRDFIVWYQHRYSLSDYSFEDRVFCRDAEMLARLREPDGKCIIPQLKEMLKNDTEEDYHIPK